MSMEAFVLGCGGMMPLPYRHLTSMLVRREGELFLFDGGEGTQVSLRRLNLKWKKIYAIWYASIIRYRRMFCVLRVGSRRSLNLAR